MLPVKAMWGVGACGAEIREAVRLQWFDWDLLTFITPRRFCIEIVPSKYVCISSIHEESPASVARCDAVSAAIAF